MTKTAQQIEDDVYLLLSRSDLAAAINGTVYKFGIRPKNSALEDVVVKFVAGLDGLFQEGNLVVNIYVPDIIFEDGTNVRDISRCSDLEAFALSWSKTLPVFEYLFSLAATIQTFEESEIKQHFISIKLNYKRLTI